MLRRKWRRATQLARIVCAPESCFSGRVYGDEQINMPRLSESHPSQQLGEGWSDALFFCVSKEHSEKYNEDDCYEKHDNAKWNEGNKQGKVHAFSSWLAHLRRVKRVQSTTMITITIRYDICMLNVSTLLLTTRLITCSPSLEL